MHQPDRSEIAGELDLTVLTRWLFILVWAAAAANALHYLARGWFPHDLGTLAQPAARVLRGQWPHRDFEDVYTGGLALLDAIGFEVLGVNAMSLRWVLFAVYLAWVPAVWYLARRLGGPVLAGAATLLAAAWTLPMYAEGMPSWYNLFLATFGTAAFFRWLEVRRSRWLFLAGLAGGLSIVVKIIGLYFVAGGLLFLAYVEVSGDERVARDSGERSSRDMAGHGAARRVVLAGAVALAALVAVLVVRAMGWEGLLRFGIPAAAPPLTLGGWIGWRGRDRSTSGGGRWRSLAALVAPFLAGVALPVVLFTLPYVASGALPELVRGVLVQPGRRFASARWSGLQGHGLGALLALGVSLWVMWAPWRRGVGGALAIAGTVLLFAVALLESGRTEVYRALWQTLWWLPPWVTLIAGATLLTGRMPPARARKIFALLSVYGLVSLVEVPFAAPVYFFYAAPLMVLLAAGLVGGGALRRRGWLLSTFLFLLGFTAVRLNPGFIRNLGFTPSHDVQSEVLGLPRAGGLRVDAQEMKEYETVVTMVQALSRGPYVYATPDCPEIYFLSARRNPTRTLFEFLDPDSNAPSPILDVLDRANVRVVVINRRPLFSPPVSDELVSGLRARYPLAREVGRFLVVWKSPADSTAVQAAPAR